MKRELQLALISLSAILLIFFIVTSFQSVSHASHANNGSKLPCITEECMFAKQTRVALLDTAIVQTNEAMPTETPLPTFTVTPVGWGSTPTLMPTAGISHMTGDFRENMPFKRATDAWTIGSVLSNDGVTQNAVDVYTQGSGDDGPAVIISIVMGDGSEPKGVSNYGEWVAPHNIGEIFITNVTGLHGIVTFKTSTGVTGTLDLAKGTWSLK